MRIDEAAEFLFARTKLKDYENAEKLAARLGRLPLALEQAGAYIVDAETDLAHYLGLINKYGLEVFDESDEVNSYNRNVKTVWNITLERLSESARQLLYCFAYMSPDLLAVDLLVEHAKRLYTENNRPGEFIDQIGKDGRPNGVKINIGGMLKTFIESKFSPELIATLSNDIKRDKAVAKLARFSLITRKADKTLAMHSLLQEVIRDEITDNVYLFSVAEVIKRLCGEWNLIWNDYRIALPLEQAKPLLLNIETILRYSKEYNQRQGIDHSDTLGLPFDFYSIMGQYLYLRGVREKSEGILEDADKCYATACDIGLVLYGGGEDVELLSGASAFTIIQEKHRRMRVNLILKRTDVARKLYEEVRKPVSKSLKQEPNMSHHAFANFGDLWFEFGHFLEAKESYEYALQIDLSEEDAEVLRAKVFECETRLTHIKT
jgi:tetratricopeptide (TPR) repeat protein